MNNDKEDSIMNQVTITAKAPKETLASTVFKHLKDIVRTYEGTMTSSNVYTTSESKQIGISFTTDIPVQDAIAMLVSHVEGVGWEVQHTAGHLVRTDGGGLEVVDF